MAEAFKVEGFDALFKQMDELSEEIGKGKTDRIWKQALGMAMQPVWDMAKAIAPGEWEGDTGQLREHIFMKVVRPTANDKNKKYYQGETFMALVYASPIRDDSIKKTVLNKRGKFQTVWTGKKPVAISQEFGNKRLMNSEFGTAAKGAHPFLRPALEANASRCQTILGYAIMDAIEKIAQKNKGKG